MQALSCPSFPLFSPPLPAASRRRLLSASTRPSAARTSTVLMPVFPYLPPAQRDLMLDLLSAVDARLGSALLPADAFPDLLRFQNSQGSAHGSVEIRPGSEISQIDFVLHSWLYCKTPAGGEINISTLFAFLNSSTDAPHLLLQLVHGSPTSLLLLLDLLPRRDLTTHPDYLDEFYEQTGLESPRQQLQSLPQVSPYYSSSLFFRTVISPTAISITVDLDKTEEALEMEGFVAGHISGAAKKVVEVWLEKCAAVRRLEIGEGERLELERRDELIKSKAIELDLAANLPRMFGQEVSERVVADIHKAFKL